ncbi:hypothetical protein [Parafrankia sp. EUN1f]|uniref:hypothetical protein n=1 Tax=Parafrankia sp. EUN1f TaxID=102897 RepID=UPI0001C451C7|nr:hypothetical protein [Parafrankia sp. EUN1f]EFC83371.1 hypothetical protein FrEUN1fDRAFT_3550 [Parafrankia sp. EUN1f]
MKLPRFRPQTAQRLDAQLPRPGLVTEVAVNVGESVEGFYRPVVVPELTVQAERLFVVGAGMGELTEPVLGQPDGHRTVSADDDHELLLSVSG